MPFPRQALELVGNLGRDPEMRYTPQGAPVTKFSLAVTRQWKQNGAEQKETTWWTVTTWDKLAEATAQLHKGQQVLIKGYVKPDAATGGPRVYTRNDGSPGAVYEFTASEVWLSLFAAAGGRSGAEPTLEDYGPGPMGDDDIPF